MFLVLRVSVFAETHPTVVRPCRTQRRKRFRYVRHGQTTVGWDVVHLDTLRAKNKFCNSPFALRWVADKRFRTVEGGESLVFLFFIDFADACTHNVFSGFTSLFTTEIKHFFFYRCAYFHASLLGLLVVLPFGLTASPPIFVRTFVKRNFWQQNCRKTKIRIKYT